MMEKFRFRKKDAQEDAKPSTAGMSFEGKDFNRFHQQYQQKQQQQQHQNQWQQQHQQQQQQLLPRKQEGAQPHLPHQMPHKTVQFQSPQEQMLALTPNQPSQQHIPTQHQQIQHQQQQQQLQQQYPVSLQPSPQSRQPQTGVCRPRYLEKQWQQVGLILSHPIIHIRCVTNILKVITIILNNNSPNTTINNIELIITTTTHTISPPAKASIPSQRTLKARERPNLGVIQSCCLH
ncbi:hypothetical protein EGW08_021894 [Elysia chlorotica]|uniref:Uncharacterized protein n=1 Tax=Elysia chlorotica TaxID=188477 RepID=A0A3S0ZLS7_ELYCH|nr:hypothetical protein EGW08_021894 [Elysia chlorotica]